MNKLIIISGCSGGGKSTLLAELKSNKYTVVPEVGRELVKEQLVEKSNLTPWENPKAFCELLIDRSIAAFNKVMVVKEAKDGMIFFDRSFLEGVSYYQTKNKRCK